jgi:acetyl-CoA carboxylase biotin carboxyl carrier protein
VETSEIFELLDRFDKSSLSEIIISKDDLRVTLRKAAASGDFHVSGLPSSGAIPTQHVVTEHAQSADISADSGQPSEDEGELITSPIVGTFYRAPSPDSPPFAEPGRRVTKGGTLCVIEAMKVMNELEAEFDCEIVDVLVENGTMIEFGTPLFKVKR